MWIFLSILLFIIILITVVLLLPVFITIKYNKDDGLYLRYKILHKTFGGESSSSDNSFAKNIKNALGLSRLEKDKLKTKAEKTNILHTVKDSFSLIVDLLKELVGLLKYCKAKIFKVNIVCANTDAAEAAISYGECCAVMMPILRYLHSLIDIKPSGKEINISCKYDTDVSSFDFETVISVRIFRIVSALLHAIFAEAKRKIKNQLSKES